MAHKKNKKLRKIKRVAIDILTGAISGAIAGVLTEIILRLLGK